MKGSPLQQTANQLKEELENYQKQCIETNQSNHLIQPRYDWEGHAHPKTLIDIVNTFKHLFFFFIFWIYQFFINKINYILCIHDIYIYMYIIISIMFL